MCKLFLLLCPIQFHVYGKSFVNVVIFSHISTQFATEENREKLTGCLLPFTGNEMNQKCYIKLQIIYTTILIKNDTQYQHIFTGVFFCFLFGY